ncbi:MAG: hypothetical protein V1858_02705 [Candidatus Gottesmanbacteria bacterium]
MFKNMIAPVQAWLLSQGRCVGCGMPLQKSNIKSKKSDVEELITCKCGRVYIYDSKINRYRRALISEV